MNFDLLIYNMPTFLLVGAILGFITWYSTLVVVNGWLHTPSETLKSSASREDQSDRFKINTHQIKFKTSDNICSLLGWILTIPAFFGAFNSFMLSSQLNAEVFSFLGFNGRESTYALLNLSGVGLGITGCRLVLKTFAERGN